MRVLTKQLAFIGENSLIILCFHLVETKILPWGHFYGIVKPYAIAVPLADILKILWASCGVLVVKKLKKKIKDS